MTEPLPIDDVLGEISERLAAGSRLVLSAPPGAGKTTRLPLHLLSAPWAAEGKLLLLEPRRIAARMAAARMASALGEEIGWTVGLSTRLDRRVSKHTRIEVITDGLFTRRVLNDPELAGVSAILFDEFHERSLNVDLGLALARDVQEGLRPDLKLLVMSATLDTGRIASALDAPVVESLGRMFPVKTIYLGRTDERIEHQMARGIRRALREQDGSLLCFLPGQGEIRRTAELIGEAGGVIVAPLYGALPPREQDVAVAPVRKGLRKVVLATDIAESSLTIEGVTVVVDSGLVRIPEHDPASGSSRLLTQRASLASVDQRRGRAGRTAPGVCYRLWNEPANLGLPKSVAPEITAADLSGLVLALAEWGTPDPAALPFIDPPPEGRVSAARQSLTAFGALTDDGRLTDLGRRVAALPLPPALGVMIESQTDPDDRALAAEMAALVGEQGLGGRTTDLRARISGFRRDSGARATALRRQADRWAGGSAGGPPDRAGVVIARAMPQLIARAQPGERRRYLLANGRAAVLPTEDPLTNEDWLVIVDTAGSAARARITAAAPISQEQALDLGHVTTVDSATFDPATRALRAERIKRMGEIILSRTPLPKPKGETAVSAILDAVRQRGLNLLPGIDIIQETQVRLELLGEGALDDEMLLGRLGDWLPPLIGNPPDLGRPSPNELRRGLAALLDWDVARRLDQDVPLYINSPAGHRLPIDYLTEGGPLIEARVQAFFGLNDHPKIAGGRVPLSVSLTSPANRQVALTRDLPGFWTGGYRDMAKDMRGRYPKHDWPEDPAAAKPHEGRTKARLEK